MVCDCCGGVGGMNIQVDIKCPCCDRECYQLEYWKTIWDKPIHICSQCVKNGLSKADLFKVGYIIGAETFARNLIDRIQEDMRKR